LLARKSHINAKTLTDGGAKTAALGYAGKKDEARAQYQKASTLDLSAAYKVKLTRQMQA
jgi:hypothetical protein